MVRNFFVSYFFMKCWNVMLLSCPWKRVLNRLVINNFPLSLFLILSAFYGHQLAQTQGKITGCLYEYSWLQFYKYIKTKLNFFCSILYSLLFNICRIASKVNQMLISSNATFLQGLLYCQWMSFPNNIQVSVLRSCSYANKLIWANNKKSLILIRSCHITEKDKAAFVLWKACFACLQKCMVSFQWLYIIGVTKIQSCDPKVSKGFRYTCPTLF